MKVLVSIFFGKSVGDDLCCCDFVVKVLKTKHFRKSFGDDICCRDLVGTIFGRESVW